MSGLKRLMNRTWSSTPAILSSRLFPPDPNLLIPPRKLTSTRFLDIYQAKLLGLSPAAVRSGRKESLQLRDGRRTIQDCGFPSALSSSMIRSSIYLTNVAEFCTSSSSTTTTTTTKTTAPRPDNSNSETGGGVGGIGGNDSGSSVAGEEDSISFTEAKRLMRLVNVEALKMKLGMEGKEVIGYSELLKACESMGVARSIKEATAFAQVLDEAGVVLLFRDKVYLHPDKVVELVRKAVPLALTPEDDPRRGELKSLEEKKEQIDILAHKQVRRILWSGLGLAILQVGLFFRLTFWEFSWDVMEPIAFFTTTTGIVIGYAYFLFTRRDPTYQDLMKRLFLSRQRKLFKRQNFDVDRLLELQRKCKSPLDVPQSIPNQMRVNLEPGDAFHSH